MPTEIDIKLGLNLEIGSVPVSLSVEDSDTADGNTITFNGCIQDYDINIGDFISAVGKKFGVDVELPPELKLEAKIDFVAGQIIHNKPKTGAASTEMGFSAKFDLSITDGGNTHSFTFLFYADTIISHPAPATGNPYVVGGAIDFDLDFSKLPLVGDIPVLNQYTFKNLGFTYTNVGPDTQSPDQPAAKPVQFRIPMVDQSQNPLFTRTPSQDPGNNKPPDPSKKNQYTYKVSGDGSQRNYSLEKKGFSITAGLVKNEAGVTNPQPEKNFSLPLGLPKTTSPGSFPTPLPAGQTATSPPDPKNPVHWININKTIGPVNLQKIGLNYASGEATFAFSAGFAMGPFAMDVQGLSITFPLPLPYMPAGKTVSFDIDGLSMDFHEGSLYIGGAFLKTQAPDIHGKEITNYFGEIIVQVGGFGFKAIGGYAPAQDGNPASFFIYANLELPLGGPPFLYISGLAFGFGINYGLILPTIDTLSGYLLLPNQAPEQPKSGAVKDALAQTITDLENGSVIINEPGEYWVAAGIEFTSFDMVSAFAMITFSFGVEMQIAFLGSCSIILPKGDPYPIASIDVDLMASITPSTGLFMVAGIITPSSYLLGPFVKLSGGFAFYLWFGGEHKGNFVITLGGYHPIYKKPDLYPTVPRMRITMNLGPLQAYGESYIALTPAMFMAGIRYSVTFSAGPVKAWFNLGADFLIGWAPFQYAADAYVSIGVSLDLGLFTISVSLGADLEIWGPPFGGKAELEILFFTITISFGSTAAEPPPVSWQDMQDNFLPKGKSGNPAGMLRNFSAEDKPVETIVSASVAAGKAGQDQTGFDGEVWKWILDPNHFEIDTATVIPANHAFWFNTVHGEPKAIEIPNDCTQYNSSTVDTSSLPYLELASAINGDKYKCDEQNPGIWLKELGVKPMKQNNVYSVHTIQLARRTKDDGEGFSDLITDVAIEPVLGKSPSALWGPSGADLEPNTTAILEPTLLGFKIMPLPRNPDKVSSVPLLELLFTQANQTHFNFTNGRPQQQVSAKLNGPDEDLIINVNRGGASTMTDKAYILSSLTDQWVSGQRKPILDELNTWFNTLAGDAIDLGAMAETETLTDWPMIGVLGAAIHISQHETTNHA